MTDKSGSAAFPHDGMPRNPSMIRRTESSGMSLRDWFAGQALAGMMANPKSTEAPNARHIADAAYSLADALLSARGEPK